MKKTIKVITATFVVMVLMYLCSISTYAATMFSMGEVTETGNYTVVPVYIESTDYDYLGGYHFFVEFPEDYAYVRCTNGIKDEWDESLGLMQMDTSALDKGRVGALWAYGENLEINNKRLLANFYFTRPDGKSLSDVYTDLSLRPYEVTYIANVGNPNINNGNGTKAIMDITEAATYITYNLPKQSDTWEGGYIERLYLSGENGTAEINNVIENEDSYTIVIKLCLNENDKKVMLNLKLLADTADTLGGEISKTGILINEFNNIIVENMNKPVY